MYICFIFVDADWFCSAKCKQHVLVSLENISQKKPKSKRKLDHVRQYTCSRVWHGLFHRARRDAERENDGEAMNIHWKIDSLLFWANNHNKYLILSHRLAAGMECVECV
jgi:hypothetical protein